MSTNRRWKASVFNNKVPAGDGATWFNSRGSCLFSLSRGASRTLDSVFELLAKGDPLRRRVTIT